MSLTRDWAISYGSFNVGGSTARQIDGEVRHTYENNFETSIIDFDFITTASTDAAFTTECKACEDAFRIPRLDFVFTQNGQTRLSLKQSDNTGLDANPTITKTGDPADTGRSIKYHVRIEFGRPADNLNNSCRRFSTINVDYSQSRQRTITIAGVYTANPSGVVGAYEQYLAAIAAYATTATNAIDATASWEKIGEPQVEQNATDKLCNFKVVFKEVIYNQAVNTKDVPELVDPLMLIDVERFSWDSSDDSGFQAGVGTNGTTSGQSAFSGTGATGNPGPLGNTTGGTTDVTQVMGGTGPTLTNQNANEKPWLIHVSYTVAVDKTITTDLAGKYKSTIRPLLISAAQSYAVGASLTLIEDKPEYDAYYNRISSTMQFIAYINNIVERHVTISDRTNFGAALTGLWSKGAFDKYKYQGQGVKIRTVLEEFVAIDTYNGAVMAMINSLAGTPPDSSPTSSLGDNWAVISREPRGTSINRGISDGGTTNYIASWAIETVLEYGVFRTANIATAGTVNANVAT